MPTREFAGVPERPMHSGHRVRVLYVVANGGGGGIERHLLALVSSLDRSALEPSVCILGERGAESDAIVAMGVPVHVLHARSGHEVIGTLRFLNVLFKLKPHVVHFQQLRLLPVFAARLTPTRIACSEHCDLFGIDTPRTARLLWRLVGPLVDRVFPVSEYTARSLSSVLGVSQKKISVFPNALDIDGTLADGAQPAPLPESWRGKRVIGGIGRLVAQKDWPLFLRTAAELAANNDSLRFLIVGDGPLRPSLEAAAAAAGIDQKTLFAGRADARRYLPLFDVLLFTSDHEQMPTVLLEAFLFRVPVAGCIPRGGTPEILAKAKADPGVFTAQRDPVDLARCVTVLLNDPARAAHVSDAAFDLVKEHFDMKKHAAWLSAVYRAEMGRA